MDKENIVSSIVIRPANPGDARAVAEIHIVGWQRTYRDLLPSEYLNNLEIVHFQRHYSATIAGAADESNQQVFYVAESLPENKVVAFVWAGPVRLPDPFYQGQFYKMYVQTDFHRQGIGRRLTLEVIDSFIRQSFSTMRLPVFASNYASCRFFEKIGGKVIDQQYITIGGVRVLEFSYGWRDIAQARQRLNELLEIAKKESL